jgi:stearoyl-CoA desaturase (delta-9 desaturase)
MKKLAQSITGWFRSDYSLENKDITTKKGIDWIGSIPFFLFHLMCFGIIWVGWSPFAVIFALIFYIIRMFSITAYYHRYFAHRSFTANRFFTFVFAFLGCSAMQRGPLWWAAIHRHHHRFADLKEDLHSPKISGFWWSHIGWILAHENKRTRIEYVKDWLKYPELVFLDRFALLVPIITGIGIYFIGVGTQILFPQFQTNGMQLLIWGLFVSTICCSHATFSINSIDHIWGTRRYDEPNTSRNNALMAFLTLGEGWHNNHHHYAVTAKAGFYWYEYDFTYYYLVILSWFGIVKNLRPISKQKREENKIIKK